MTFDDLVTAAGLAKSPATFVMAHCDGGYTTNLPVNDLIEGKAMVATLFDGLPLLPSHGGPARLLVPHLYFWKSAKWMRRITFRETDTPGFWESLGYHMYGDPWREQRYLRTPAGQFPSQHPIQRQRGPHLRTDKRGGGQPEDSPILSRLAMPALAQKPREAELVTVGIAEVKVALSPLGIARLGRGTVTGCQRSVVQRVHVVDV